MIHQGKLLETVFPFINRQIVIFISHLLVGIGNFPHYLYLLESTVNNYTVNSPYSEHNLQGYFFHYIERFTIWRDNSYEPPMERFTKIVHYMEMFTI